MRSARPANSSTPTCARSSPGISTPRPARPSGWNEAKSFTLRPAQGQSQSFDDLKKFGLFEDEWLRGGPVRRWVPKALADKPIYVFETGGTTGMPKSRIAIEDFRIDYEMFSDTLPDEYFPKGANWLMLGPSRPAPAAAGGRAPLPVSRRHLLLRRPRSALGRQADQEGLDGAPRSLQGALHRPGDDDPVGRPRHQVHVHHAQAARIAGRGAWRSKARASQETGITGIFSGGTEFTPQWTRFAIEELLEGVYMTPTYGNTLMGLACSKPVGPEDGYKISYYAPQPRAVVEVVDFDDYDKVVDYGETGRVKLTTLTKEFFVPGFLERDEGEREQPYEKYPWDGVSGVRPFHEFAAATTVGVY